MVSHFPDVAQCFFVVCSQQGFIMLSTNGLTICLDGLAHFL